VGLLDRMLGGGAIDLGAPYERLLPGDTREVEAR
jgi:hypothetical protein